MSRKRAPGPYNYDDDEDYVPSKAVKYSEREDVGPLKVKKHTLDSDEEEDELEGDDQNEDKNYDVLKEEDIDGTTHQADSFIRLFAVTGLIHSLQLSAFTGLFDPPAPRSGWVCYSKTKLY
ncbi:hypothetical protein E2C01_069915 [Portunus trituberculatus]|uniref:Uncharacterized protein n=1 Tax=Portunus trituberculatus TaxID=210409 RepID=A0A5B7I076_PORTR|nr:hypothetical protein [Portunus trituberculatus]